MVSLAICIVLALAALQRADLSSIATLCSNSDDTICDSKGDDTGSGVLLQRKASQLAMEKFRHIHRAKPKAHAEERVSSTCSLDEQGYTSVLALKNPNEFYALVERVLDAMGLQVVDERTMVAKFLHNKPEAFNKFLGEILQGLHGHKFLKSTVDSPKDGSDPKLNDDGYKFVLQQHDDEKMKKFIQRVAYKKGFEVTNFGSLEGMTPFYSGKTGIQSFGALEDELQKVAKLPDGWLKAVAQKTAKRKSSEAQEDRGKQRNVTTKKGNTVARRGQSVKENERKKDKHVKASQSRDGSMASRKKSNQAKHLHGWLKAAAQRTGKRKGSEAREEKGKQRKLVTKKGNTVAQRDQIVKETERKHDKHAKASHSRGGSMASRKKSSKAKNPDRWLKATAQRTGKRNGSEAREGTGKQRKGTAMKQSTAKMKKKMKEKVAVWKHRIAKATQRKNDKKAKAKASHSRGGSIASKEESRQATHSYGWFKDWVGTVGEQQSSDTQEEKTLQTKLAKRPRHPKAAWRELGNTSVYVPTVVLGTSVVQ